MSEEDNFGAMPCSGLWDNVRSQRLLKTISARLQSAGGLSAQNLFRLNLGMDTVPLSDPNILAQRKCGIDCTREQRPP